MDAPIRWINGTEVVAAGGIDQALHQDVIVTKNGLIVPVVVTPDWLRPKPFDAMKTLPDECFEEMEKFVGQATKTNAQGYTQLALLQGDPYLRPLPKIAIEIDSHLGIEIASTLDDEFEGAEIPAHRAIAKQRRENLRVLNGE